MVALFRVGALAIVRWRRGRERAAAGGRWFGREGLVVKSRGLASGLDGWLRAAHGGVVEGRVRVLEVWGDYLVEAQMLRRTLARIEGSTAREAVDGIVVMGKRDWREKSTMARGPTSCVTARYRPWQKILRASGHSNHLSFNSTSLYLLRL